MGYHRIHIVYNIHTFRYRWKTSWECGLHEFWTVPKRCARKRRCIFWHNESIKWQVSIHRKLCSIVPVWLQSVAKMNKWPSCMTHIREHIGLAKTTHSKFKKSIFGRWISRWHTIREVLRSLPYGKMRTTSKEGSTKTHIHSDRTGTLLSWGHFRLGHPSIPFQCRTYFPVHLFVRRPK